MTSGEFLRNLREDKEFSLRELSDKTGVSHTQIADIERGVNFGKRATLEVILTALNASKNERKVFFELQDLERTPDTIKGKIIELENALSDFQNSDNQGFQIGQINNNGKKVTTHNYNDNTAVSSKRYGEIQKDIEALSNEQFKIIKQTIKAFVNSK
ncbi:MAG: helix-turn-helix domain-containing protein [Fusobacteriaceae bacterium]